MWQCVCNLTQDPYTVVAQTKTVVRMREGAGVYIRMVGLERSVLLTVERARRYRLRSTYLPIRLDVLKPPNMSCIPRPYVANNFRVKDGQQLLLNFI